MFLDMISLAITVVGIAVGIGPAVSGTKHECENRELRYDERDLECLI